MEKSEEKAKLFSFRYLIHDFIKLTAAIPGVLWYRPKILYVGENAKKRIRGGAVLMSNHNGFFDPVELMFIVWYRRHHFICGKELTDSRGGFILKSFLCIPIDRENFGMATFREITGHLKKGELITIFPEGHINTDEDGSIGAFKTGMVLMAVRSGKPIIPVYIGKKEHFFSRLTAAVGEPVDVTAMYGSRPTFAQIDEAAELLYTREEELKKCIENRRNRT